MAEASRIEYRPKELAEVIVRDQGIKEGHWMVLIRFAHTAGNLDTGDDKLAPAVISRIESIGIQRVPEPNPMSVDASLMAQRQRKAVRATVRAKAKAKA